MLFNDPDAGPPRSLGFIKKRLAFLVEKQKKRKQKVNDRMKLLKTKSLMMNKVLINLRNRLRDRD